MSSCWGVPPRWASRACGQDLVEGTTFDQSAGDEAGQPPLPEFGEFRALLLDEAVAVEEDRVPRPEPVGIDRGIELGLDPDGQVAPRSLERARAARRGTRGRGNGPCPRRAGVASRGRR